MTIHIIDEPDVYMTREEYTRLEHEYRQAFMFYAGPVPTFEQWVTQRRGGTKTTTAPALGTAV